MVGMLLLSGKVHTDDLPTRGPNVLTLLLVK